MRGSGKPRGDIEKLVARARDGDSKAYGAIFRAFYKDIYDYVYRRVGNRSDAEDLTMDVFAQGLKAIGGYEERGLSIKAWFYRIAHNAVVDHFRKQRQTVELKETTGTDRGETEERVLQRDVLRGIQREIKNLTPAQSEVLTLRFITGMSVSETAATLGKEESNIRALQFKGLKRLRKTMLEIEMNEKAGGRAETVPGE